MCPRSRRVHDQDVALAAAEILTERGAGAVTFAQVAQRCGLAPPTLVQRFGDKDGMMAAANEALRVQMMQAFREPLPDESVITGLLARLRRLASSHSAVAGMAGLPQTAAYSLELRKQISYCLAAAIEAGELPRCDVAMLARTIQTAFTGAVVLAMMEGTDVGDEAVLAVSAQLSGFI